MRDEVVTSWNAIAANWAAMQGVHGDGNQQWIINPALFELASDVAGRRVLDAACGGGHVARELARRGALVTAVDIAASMVEIAARADGGLGITYRTGDLCAMPGFADGAFDLVVSSMALMNVADIAGTFAEFGRVLRAGGRLVFSIPHPCYPRRSGSGGVMCAGADGIERLDYYRVSEYQSEGCEVVPLPDAQGQLHPVPTFHRTLTTYFRLLTNVTFVVDGFVEPMPPDLPEAKAELEDVWWDMTRRIPYYLVMRARKA